MLIDGRYFPPGKDEEGEFLAPRTELLVRLSALAAREAVVLPEQSSYVRDYLEIGPEDQLHQWGGYNASDRVLLEASYADGRRDTVRIAANYPGAAARGLLSVIGKQPEGTLQFTIIHDREP